MYQQRVGLLGLYRLAFGFAELRLIAAATIASAGWLVLASAAPADWAAAAAQGALAWSVSEYVLHRFVLHLPQPRSPRLRKIHERLHWRHHQEPDEPRLLFVPLGSTVFMLALAFAIGFAMGGVHAAAGATLGLGTMLFVYETTHLAAHVNYRPRTRLGRYLKRFHLLHHYKNERYWFGVTHPLMDLLAGTWPAHTEIEKSSTARTLGVDQNISQ
jgi:4-hydroxysphinganine ceramide fatty acyl 2-hydroxylase